MLSAQTSHAGSATWNLNPGSGDWNTATNWTPATVPNGPTDTATFALSNTTSVSLSANTVVDGIGFNAGGAAYTITAPAGRPLTLSGAGIANTSGILQNFVTVDGTGTNFGTIAFHNGATAGSGTMFTNNGGTVANAASLTAFFDNSTAGSGTFTNQGGLAGSAGGGNLFFWNNSTAGNAIVSNNGGAASGAGDTLGAGGGLTIFRDSSTAGNGTFTNQAGLVSSQQPARGGNTIFHNNSTAGNGIFTTNGTAASGRSPGVSQFRDTSTAGNGIFTTNGGTASGALGGETIFSDSSTAGNATLRANGGVGGATGGIISLSDGSSGGTSRVEVFGNGNLDISFDDGPSVTVGSIEGDGIVFLAGNNLIVGSNNLSTTLSGVVQEGPFGNGNGSLTKIGSATLRLSGANTYFGSTTVNAGRLFANNSTGSGTGSGTVMVNNSGGVLGGIGTISGPVTVNTGTALLGGNATTASGSLKVANNVTLNTGSIIELVLGASGTHSTLTRTGGTWTFAPNQRFTFLDVGAQPGFYDDIITGLAADPGGTASWIITNAGFTGTFTYDGAGNIDLNLTSALGPAVQLTSAVSRKTHGAAGDFDIPLPLTGEPGVECRYGHGNHTLIFAFNNNVVSGNASVMSGAASVAGSPTFVGTTMTVNLTGVTDVQKITVTLSNVTDSFAQVLPDTAVSMNMLVGDVTGNKTVNATDTAVTKGQSGAPVSNSNFREDVTANGAINGADINLVKFSSGHTLP